MAKLTAEKNLCIEKNPVLSQKEAIYGVIAALTNPNATERHPPLELQEDFCEQRSLVQEDIQAAGHLLPKFHYELNYSSFRGW